MDAIRGQGFDAVGVTSSSFADVRSCLGTVDGKCGWRTDREPILEG
jgi:hypothetical protein